MSGKTVHIDIQDERGIDSKRAASIPAFELTSRGFDLINVDDNDSLILPKGIAAMIWRRYRQNNAMQVDARTARY